MPLVIYHNEECSKSNTALDLLLQHDASFKIRNYIKDPLNLEELDVLLLKLNLPASAVVRKNETIYKDLFEGKELREEEWKEALQQYPVLLERPIAANDDRAIVARPPEVILEFIK
jgi:arsenate reductase